MPLRSADNPGSTFSTRGGCVHTIEKPKPFSAVRVNFFVHVNGVRPCEEYAGGAVADGSDAFDDFFCDERRRQSMLPVDAGTADTADTAGCGGSNSRNRRNRFSSASRWWMAFLLRGI